MNSFQRNQIVFDADQLSSLAQAKSAIDSEMQKFTTVLNASEKILFKTSSVFPFDLFPDEITIDECKINIVFHEFFLSEDIHSITIDMIKDVKVEHGPFFASLKIVPDGYPGQPLEVRYLKKEDAIKARRIVQGLIVARKQGLDPAKLDFYDFINKIESLGATHLVE